MQRSKTKIAVVGATGYTGLLLSQLLLRHPFVEIQTLVSESYSGKKFSEIYPAFSSLLDLRCSELSLSNLSKSELVFFATPNGLAYKFAGDLIKAGIRVIDLSADYRFRDLAVYTKAYGFKRSDRALNNRSIYALPEFRKAEIAKSRGVISNPGCYTTASILALTPLLRAHKTFGIDLDSVIIDAKSGLSGAGRKAVTEQLYAEVAENISPYKLAGQHRHVPELEAFWSEDLQRELPITFSPHLVPMTRGLLVTCYLRSSRKLQLQKLRALYQEVYKGEPFVQLLEAGVYPQSKWVVNTNRALIQIDYDERRGQIIVTAVIDNLIKGAAGQALQNMNIILGYPETTALELSPYLP